TRDPHGPAPPAPQQPARRAGRGAAHLAALVVRPRRCRARTVGGRGMTASRRTVLLAGSIVLAAGAGVTAAPRAAAPAAAASDLDSEVVFTADRGHVHASSIVETPSGGLYTAWYENGDPSNTGPFEGQDLDKREDVRIAGARRASG